jgi:hypothetical protein
MNPCKFGPRAENRPVLAPAMRKLVCSLPVTGLTAASRLSPNDSISFRRARTSSSSAMAGKSLLSCNLGESRPGKARRGLAGQGAARKGKARQEATPETGPPFSHQRPHSAKTRVPSPARGLRNRISSTVMQLSGFVMPSTCATANCFHTVCKKSAQRRKALRHKAKVQVSTPCAT